MIVCLLYTSSRQQCTRRNTIKTVLGLLQYSQISSNDMVAEQFEYRVTWYSRALTEFVEQIVRLQNVFAPTLLVYRDVYKRQVCRRQSSYVVDPAYLILSII